MILGSNRLVFMCIRTILRSVIDRLSFGDDKIEFENVKIPFLVQNCARKALRTAMK